MGVWAEKITNETWWRVTSTKYLGPPPAEGETDWTIVYVWCAVVAAWIVVGPLARARRGS